MRNGKEAKGKKSKRGPSASAGELQTLKARLAETEETLRAIRAGELDALVVSTPTGEKLFTLSGAELPYRVFLERINEGALTVAPDGTVLYSNLSFAKVLGLGLERIIGTDLFGLVSPVDRPKLKGLLSHGQEEGSKGVVEFSAEDGQVVPLLLSVIPQREPQVSYCIVATDMTEQTRSEEALRATRDELDFKVRERTADLERTTRLLKAEVLDRALSFRELSHERELLMAALGKCQDALVISDDTGKVRFMNPSAERALGQPLAVVKGWPLGELLESLKGRQKGEQAVVTLLSRDGSVTRKDARHEKIDRSLLCSVAVYLPQD